MKIVVTKISDVTPYLSYDVFPNGNLEILYVDVLKFGVYTHLYSLSVRPNGILVEETIMRE